MLQRPEGGLELLDGPSALPASTKALGGAQACSTRDGRTVAGEATHVGSTQCASCHKTEYARWAQSHHAKAMAQPGDSTVLGNFNDASFTQGGVTSLPRAHDGNGASEFKQAIPATRGPATTLADRGANAPKARYMTTSAFETIALCLTDKRGNCAIATGGDQGRLSAPKRSQ